MVDFAVVAVCIVASPVGVTIDAGVVLTGVVTDRDPGTGVVGGVGTPHGGRNVWREVADIPSLKKWLQVVLGVTIAWQLLSLLYPDLLYTKDTPL